MLLSILFLFCAMVIVSVGLPLWSAVFIWLFLLVFIVLISMVWTLPSSVYRAGILTRIKQRFSQSRLNYVLDAYWKEGRYVLKRINRHHQHYPWFIVTGEKSGKTALLSGCSLPVSGFQVDTGPVTPTRTVRWFFFRTVGFLEVSSRFLNDSAAYRQAIKVLMRCLRWVPRPAGIIVCFSCSDLVLEENELLIRARKIRIQTEKIFQATGRRLPVHLVLTNCEHLPGFSVLASQLSASQQNMPLGYYWKHSLILDRQDPSSLDAFFDAVCQDTGHAISGMLYGAHTLKKEDVSALLSLPASLQSMRRALCCYTSALCGPDAYFRPGYLAGIWLTTAQPRPFTKKNSRSLFFSEVASTLLPASLKDQKPEYSNIRQRVIHKLACPVLAAVLCVMLIVSWGTVMGAFPGAPEKMNNSDIISQLNTLDALRSRPLIQYPFRMLLQRREQALSSAVMSRNACKPANITEVVSNFRHQFKEAGDATRRTMMLSLANTILTRKAIGQHLSLSEAMSLPAIPVPLRMTCSQDNRTFPAPGLHANHEAYSAPPAAGYTLDVVRLRQHIPTKQGQTETLALQQLLRRELNESDPLKWLTTSDSHFTPVALTDFYPQSASREKLEGIWTLPGQKQVRAWLETITQAASEKNHTLTRLQTRLDERQQSVWLQFLLAAVKTPLPVYHQAQWAPVLVDIDEGNSSASALLATTREQLAAVSEENQQPWLGLLRQMGQLNDSGTKPSWATRLRAKSHLISAGFRQYVLHKKTTVPLHDTAAQQEKWNEWKHGIHLSVARALTSTSQSEPLTTGLFSPSSGPEQVNPLATLENHYTSLRHSLTPSEESFEEETIWHLVHFEAELLTEHALNHSACRLQQQWQEHVLWPLSRNSDEMDYDEQEEMAGQYIGDFVKTAAKPVLSFDSNGAHPAKTGGQHIPVTPEFLRLVNHVLSPEDVVAMPKRHSTAQADKLEKLKEKESELDGIITDLESKPIPLQLESLPATVPGAAQVMPTGSQVSLFCDNQPQRLNSMNFSEHAEFHWQPGHCDRVQVIIRFPGFSLEHNYTGDDAWIQFLDDIADGHHIWPASDFPEQESTLQSLHIKNVMVRFHTGKTSEIYQVWEKWDEQSRIKIEYQDEQELYEENTQTDALNGRLSALPEKIATCQ